MLLVTRALAASAGLGRELNEPRSGCSWAQVLLVSATAHQLVTSTLAVASIARPPFEQAYNVVPTSSIGDPPQTQRHSHDCKLAKVAVRAASRWMGQVDAI